MEEASSLEVYLRDADIDLFGHFDALAGGGHPSKQLVVIRGGVGALAKLARSEPETRQCRSEVGAYVLAHALGWDDLVPVTVYREVPSPDGMVEASVQVLWPAFATAQEQGISETSVGEAAASRAAILDALLLNSDRNAGNWGLVAGTKLALIDHGHTALSDLPGWSGFAAQRRGQEISDEQEERLEAFVSQGFGRLAEAVAEEYARSLVDRAARMLQSGAIEVDG